MCRRTSPQMRNCALAPWGFMAPASPFVELVARAALARRLAREISRFDRHKTPKRSLAGLSKAHRRWYIPLAPRGFGPGCLLRKPPDGIGASALAKSVSVFGEARNGLSRG